MKQEQLDSKIKINAIYRNKFSKFIDSVCVNATFKQETFIKVTGIDLHGMH